MKEYKTREIYKVAYNTYYLLVYEEDELVSAPTFYCMVASGDIDTIKWDLLESKNVTFEVPRKDWEYMERVSAAEMKYALDNFRSAMGFKKRTR